MLPANLAPLYQKAASTAGAATRDSLEKDSKRFKDAMQIGLVPYFVSGPLSKKFNIIGILGAFAHVVSWLLIVALDGAINMNIVAKKEHQSTADKVAYDLWLFGFIPVFLAFLIVVLSTGLHMLAYVMVGKKTKSEAMTSMWPRFLVAEGLFPPVLMSIITSALTVSILFSFALLTTNSIQRTTMSCKEWNDDNTCKTMYTADEASDYFDNWRRMLCYGLLAKMYVFQFFKNNIAYSNYGEDEPEWKAGIKVYAKEPASV